MSNERELESLALAGHSAMFFLNVLAVVYQSVRRKPIHIAVHSAGIVYHGWSCVRHYQSLNGGDNERVPEAEA